MEYSLTKIAKDGVKHIIQFNTLDELLIYIRVAGEIDGWILRVHHM